MKKLTVSFLIPAYNDEATIANVVKEADAVAGKIASNYEIIVINDASGDNTQKILDSLKKPLKRLKVITHQINQGYGQTIKELYNAGSMEWLYTNPGDRQIVPNQILKLIPFTDKADMILGWRVNRHDPQGRKRQSKIYNTLLRTLLGMTLHDVNTVRLMRSAMMKKLKLQSSSAFVDAELALKAGVGGFKTIEVPIDHRQRQDETGGGGGNLKTILPVIKDMLWYWIKNIW